jgi:hypothetical protein
VDPYTIPAVPSISGANYRGSTPRTIVEPDSSEANGRVLPPRVKPLPDPDAELRRQSPSRAPQLLDPGDKTALGRRDPWAVVPAVWPTAQRGGRVVSHTSDSSPYLQHASSQQSAHAYEPVRRFVPAAEAAYDDGGWQSAR